MLLFLFNQDQGDGVILQHKLALLRIYLSEQLFDGEDVILTLIPLDLHFY